MRYAETGFDLEIDLSRGSIEKVANETDLAEYYLGGQGVAAKILFERVPPDTDPFSPDNLLIFSTGLLHATPAPAANRTVVNTFSPQTNLMSHSLFGGFFGPELKHAGYDRIIIRGKAPGPGLSLHQQRQGRNPRRHASARQGLHRRPATCSRRS